MKLRPARRPSGGGALLRPLREPDNAWGIKGMIKQLTSRFALAGAGLAALLASACVPSVPEPAPSPSPAPSPAPAPAPVPEPAAPIVTELPTPTYENWMDAPATPGDWIYSSQPSETRAVFAAGAGAPLLVISCDLASRRVSVARHGGAAEPGQEPAQGPAQMRILTEHAERVLLAQPQADGGVAAELPAFDPLLDAMAFSKGRFAVETGGRETLYVPAYPEITRVIEDCRAGQL